MERMYLKQCLQLYKALDLCKIDQNESDFLKRKPVGAI